MKQLAFLFWLLHACGVAHGQFNDTATVELADGTRARLESQLPGGKTPSTLPAASEYSSQKIEIRKFDQKKWEEIVGSRNYTETRTQKKAPQDKAAEQRKQDGNTGPRVQDSDEDGVESYEYDDPESSDIDLSWMGFIGQIIFYVAIAAIIAVILLQIVRSTPFKSNSKKITSALSPDDIQDISELDTEDLIQKAHHARDYKLAIRLYFLDLLKKLNENGMIVWTRDKTNRDYLSELFSKQYYFDEIRRLTLAYERVWYGEHLPTEERYQELKSEFHEINQKFKVL